MTLFPCCFLCTEIPLTLSDTSKKQDVIGHRQFLFLFRVSDSKVVFPAKFTRNEKFSSQDKDPIRIGN